MRVIDALWDIPGQDEKNISPVRGLCPFGADAGGQAGQDAPAYLSLLDRSRGERVEGKRVGHGSHPTAPEVWWHHQQYPWYNSSKAVSQLGGTLVLKATGLQWPLKVGSIPLALWKCLNMAGTKEPRAAERRAWLPSFHRKACCKQRCSLADRMKRKRSAYSKRHYWLLLPHLRWDLATFSFLTLDRIY